MNSWMGEKKKKEEKNHVQHWMDSTSNTSTNFHEECIINLSIFVWLSNVKWQKRIELGVQCWSNVWDIARMSNSLMSVFSGKFRILKMLLANAGTRLLYYFKSFSQSNDRWVNCIVPSCLTTTMYIVQTDCVQLVVQSVRCDCRCVALCWSEIPNKFSIAQKSK